MFFSLPDSKGKDKSFTLTPEFSGENNSTLKDLKFQPDVVAHAFNHNTLEAGAGVWS